ncbi:KxYKxGKxW signal peptide domain-containing protein [Shewanella algae]|nr:KxYKxGKxW signal peptide domain-containing protein [Shewanella algae]MBO2550144.1 KxYKxGKxW signal peptide domain-containing protein [Shewanella algae]
MRLSGKHWLTATPK